jgi:putative chitinase
MLTAEKLKALKIGEQWLDPLNETFERYGIDTPIRQASFIGQCGHECAQFKILEENLNYRAETLMRIWPKRFPTLEFAKQFEKNPKKIANTVYANRMGNRDEASGDGWRFRGRGCLQSTGSAQYYHTGKALGIDLIMEPDLLATPKYAALSAGFFWDTHKLNEFADQRSFVKMTKKINGGTIGLDDRIKHINHAYDILNS